MPAKQRIEELLLLKDFFPAGDNNKQGDSPLTAHLLPFYTEYTLLRLLLYFGNQWLQTVSFLFCQELLMLVLAELETTKIFRLGRDKLD